MITCKLVLCCESLVRDAETNVISAFNIFEEMSAPGFPVAVPRLSTLFLLEKDTEDAEPEGAEFVLTLDERELLRTRVTANFDGKPRTRVMIALQGLILPGTGLLRATLHIGDEDIGSWSLPVAMLPAPIVGATQR